MNTRALLVISAVALAGGLGSAAAGPCTAEIDGFAKTLASQDAGSGPTPGASGASAGTMSANASPAEHPPTAAMGAAAAGKATSPDDVRRQTQGEPTAAQAGNASSPAGPDMAGATAALARARDLDRQGKDAECMAAVRQAEQLAQQKN